MAAGRKLQSAIKVVLAGNAHERIGQRRPHALAIGGLGEGGRPLLFSTWWATASARELN
jgi:hypothetical protein